MCYKVFIKKIFVYILILMYNIGGLKLSVTPNEIKSKVIKVS